MLTKDDISGLYVMPPTPCIEGGEHWSVTSSVDLEESARMTDSYIRDGVSGISICGTAGECAALLWEEKRDFIDTVVQTARHRVPIFAGATALGTKETIRQMRAFKDMGADGVFVGLPLWQTPTIENAVRFYADVNEAVPDFPIMVYSNARVFKFTFPVPFWVGVAKAAPAVITNKVASQDTMRNIEEVQRLTGDRISYLPGNPGGAYTAWKQVGNAVKGFWSTQAAMGPAPLVAFADAMQRNDEARMQAILEDINAIPVPWSPAMNVAGQPGFTEYEAQVQKATFDASDYVKAGPSRAPYYREELPEDWQTNADSQGKAWAELAEKYAKSPV